MIRRIIYSVLWITGITMIVISLGFSSGERHSLICRGIEIDIRDSSVSRFINTYDVQNWMKKHHPEIYGKLIDSIDIRVIEDELSGIEAIDNVDVFTALNSNDTVDGGTIVIKITQRQPVFRVYSRKLDYYVDNDGEIINWTPRYTPRAILVIGDFSKGFARESLLPLVKYIVNDQFWKAQIDNIFVNSNGELKFIPRVGDHEIIFGKPDNYRTKLRNLKKLYTDGFRDGGWTKYKSINVKFENQIVCTKK